MDEWACKLVAEYYPADPSQGEECLTLTFPVAGTMQAKSGQHARAQILARYRAGDFVPQTIVVGGSPVAVGVHDPAIGDVLPVAVKAAQ